MKRVIKNSVIFFVMNFLLIILFNLGIPTKELNPSLDILSKQIISFLIMSFNFFTTENLIGLIGAWVISINVYALFGEIDEKTPVKLIIQEIILIMISISVLARNAPAYYSTFRLQIYFGAIVSCLPFIWLYIVIIIRKMSNKVEEEPDYIAEYQKRGYITKCKKCGKEFQSNPEFCDNCNATVR